MLPSSLNENLETISYIRHQYSVGSVGKHDKSENDWTGEWSQYALEQEEKQIEKERDNDME